MSWNAEVVQLPIGRFFVLSEQAGIAKAIAMCDGRLTQVSLRNAQIVTLSDDQFSEATKAWTKEARDASAAARRDGGKGASGGGAAGGGAPPPGQKEDDAVAVKVASSLPSIRNKNGSYEVNVNKTAEGSPSACQ